MTAFHRLRRVVPLLLAAALILGACSQTATQSLPQTGITQPAATQPAGSSQQSGSQQEVTVDVTPNGVNIPKEVPAGYVTFTANNTTQDGFDFSIAQLNSGVTSDQLTQAFQQGPDAALPLVTLYGGGSAQPGNSGSTTVNLPEGSYAAVAIPQSDAPPQFAFFTVTGSSQGSAPKADLKASLVDFNFQLPDKISAGQQVWEVTNTGTQVHELYIVKPSPGVTQDTILEMMQATEAPNGPPPWTDAGYFGPISPGKTGWVNLNLDPGTYIVICFLPDTNSGQPHVMLGMIKTIQVQ